MIELNIPGRGVIQIDHLVSDVNGTLALDGKLIDGVASALLNLGDRLNIHLLTADTHGRQASIDQQLGLEAVRISPGGESEAKEEYVRSLSADRVVALGQGANDAGMLSEALLGICVHSPEGIAAEALAAADVVAPDILSALALLENPMRLVATLRR
jgi:P-type E1-E2 ATPase